MKSMELLANLMNLLEGILADVIEPLLAQLAKNRCTKRNILVLKDPLSNFNKVNIGLTCPLNMLF